MVLVLLRWTKLVSYLATKALFCISMSVTYLIESMGIIMVTNMDEITVHDAPGCRPAPFTFYPMIQITNVKGTICEKKIRLIIPLNELEIILNMF